MFAGDYIVAGVRRVGLSVHQLSLLPATITVLSRSYCGMSYMLAIIITPTLRELV